MHGSSYLKSSMVWLKQNNLCDSYATSMILSQDIKETNKCE